MLVTLIPLFDESMSVKAYSISSQKKNFLLEPTYMSAATQVDAVNVPSFEIIESLGINTLSADNELFVPISSVSLFSDLVTECKAPHNRIVLLLDKTVLPEDIYIERITALKQTGFKFAIKNLNVPDFEPYRSILKLMDYILLNHQKIVISKAKIYFNQVYPHLKLIASGISSMGIFDSLKFEGGYKFYEGEFYRMPVTKGDTEVSPLKINYIALLNLVNSDDFELTEAADIIGRDTALIIALLKMVNKINRSSTEITSIRHAAAMLGQKELKKWITTAITQQLCADRPSEITRLSLLRAKFAENLAGTFELGVQASELFLMGLFSVVDLILNKPMDQALDLLKVTKNINSALIDHAGPYVDVLDFIKLYEAADWQAVSRIMLLNNIPMEAVHDAYISSLEWYRDLFHDIDNTNDNQV
ncbi:MAG: HDOD domain-containing protein [Lachnospiraceae bacterium]|nr:HDOD domain-containing protein [Lachnospiraceae bacterium]